MKRRLAHTFAVIALACGVIALPTVAGAQEGDCPVVKAKLLEYKIKLSKKSVTGDCVTFKIVNRGVEDHELIVTKAKSADDLAQKKGVVDEDEVDIVDETGDISSRKKKTLTVDVTPGKYVLFCNVLHEHSEDKGDGMSDMSGDDAGDDMGDMHEHTKSESHFGEGMHTVFTVK